MKPTTPSLAKLTPPKLPKIVERTRLYKELDQARDRPIIWITAPPGMGKTTLAASYIKARKLKCLWYQVDEGDTDPATLFHYLGLASKKIAPRYKQPLPNLTPEYLPGLSVFTRRFFENLYSRLKPPAVLVFDNYQLLPPDTPVQDLISLGFHELPPTIRIIVLSRMEAPVTFVRLDAEQRIHRVPETALRLTRKEISEVVQLRGKHPSQAKPSEGLSTKIEKSTGGWAAGVVLSLEHGMESFPDRETETFQTPEIIFDYLGREVFRGLTKEIQEVLLKTALSPSVSEALAVGLTENPRAGNILSQLCRRRYFIERRREPQVVYQFHPMFKEFLQALARESFPPGEIQHFQLKIGQFLVKEGQSEDAITMFRASATYEEMEGVILAQAPALAVQGRFQTLKNWLEALPSDHYHQQPWLLYWQAACNRVFNFPRSQKEFERAFDLFGEQENREGALASWIRIMEGIVIQGSNTETFREWKVRLENILGTPETFPSKVLEAQVKCCLLGSLWFYEPKSFALQKLADEVLRLFPLIPTLFEQVQMAAHIMAAMGHLGEIDKAKVIWAELETRLQAGPIPNSTRIGYLFAKSLYHCHFGNLEQGIRSAELGVELAEQECLEPLKPLIKTQLITTYLLERNVRKAGPILGEIGPLCDQLPGYIRVLVIYQQAWFFAIQQENEQAWKLLNQALSFDDGYQAGGSLVWIRVFMIIIADRLRMSQDSQQQLREAERLVGVTELPFFQFHLGLAKCWLNRGKEEESKKLLRETLSVGKRGNFNFCFGQPGHELAWLCGKALEWNIEVSYVQEIIRRMKLLPDRNTTQNPKWPWPVKIISLGSFRFEIDSEPPNSSRKPQRRPLAFLKALISRGGQEIDEVTLSDALWPEADGDKAHQAFASTLHRVRKLLKHEAAIQLQGGKVSINQELCWVDAWAFEHLLKNIPSLDSSGGPEPHLEMIQQAVQLYSGSFLPEEDQIPWTALCESGSEEST